MSNRRWDEMEVFHPLSKKIYGTLSNVAVLGNNPGFDDLPILMAVAKTTNHPVLRHKAVVALDLYLIDCSGTDASMKPEVNQLLESLYAQLPEQVRPERRQETK
jgi:hypothetical protein